MKDIGGFFELEIARKQTYYPGATELNSARNCLAYFIRTKQIRKIAAPAYTCPFVWDAIEGAQCEIELYNIGSDFLPDREFAPDAYILYTNYFGLCNRQVEQLSKRYANLIVDCAQAFFCKPAGIATFYSPRKFFGVPDGGLLLPGLREARELPRDSSLGRMTHLLKRIELGSNAAYGDFQAADLSLDDQPVQQMSKLTHALLEGIEYREAARKRRQNFDLLHNGLKHINKLSLSRSPEEVPMVYPLLCDDGAALKKRLIAHRIYVATYWAGQKDPGFGSELERDLVCLPIDQRYDESDMNLILEVLNE